MLIRYARGEGVILEGDFAPFHDVTVRPASGAEVRAWLERTARPGAKLPLGGLASLTDVPFLADAGGFNRHTFLCGQSGSGKTYSLGVILERLLTETDLRLVILDPNSDFVRLGTVRADTDPELAERYRQAARGVTVLSADAPGERRLRIHAADIDPATQAAVLRLDPIADREEYATLAGMLARPDRSTLRRSRTARNPRRAASPCASATSVSTGSRCGRPARPARSSTRCTTRAPAAWLSTWARCRRARSSP